MKPAEFVKWQQKVLLGASFKIVAPTGQYDPTKLINWGNHRWAFKPEFGYSQRWGHWILDGYAAVWFFTTNFEFFSHNVYYSGVQRQTQSPIGAFETHLSYDVRPRLWVSLDGNFWFGGKTSLNGVENPVTLQRSSRCIHLRSRASDLLLPLPLCARNSLPSKASGLTLHRMSFPIGPS